MENSIGNTTPENGLDLKKQIEELDILFTKVEDILKKEGREKAKIYLENIYDNLIILNKRDKEDWANIWTWNQEGDLTEDEFDGLNLRRKLLSNAIGIMTSSGEIRHNLNRI